MTRTHEREALEHALKASAEGLGIDRAIRILQNRKRAKPMNETVEPTEDDEMDAKRWCELNGIGA